MWLLCVYVIVMWYMHMWYMCYVYTMGKEYVRMVERVSASIYISVSVSESGLIRSELINQHDFKHSGEGMHRGNYATISQHIPTIQPLPIWMVGIISTRPDAEWPPCPNPHTHTRPPTHIHIYILIHTHTYTHMPYLLMHVRGAVVALPDRGFTSDSPHGSRR